MVPADEKPPVIAPPTRRNVIDWLRAEGVRWRGRLDDESFLDRVVDLDSLPSTDDRFDTARADIRQHTVNNNDWDNDWVFDYGPLALLSGPSDRFARFLSEMVHPIVRPDTDEARKLVAELNDLLRPDRVALTQVGTIGKRPVWVVRPTGRTAVGAIRPEASQGLDGDAPRLWTPGMFRLFISHVSAHKLAVSSLKTSLAAHGVAAFVAHEDIEPSREWQVAIELALETADALAAVLTPDFHQSRWTDQEVGVALGRGRLVLPLRAPDNPYGLMGKLQGLNADLDSPGPLAARIVDVLLSRPETANAMRDGLIRRLELANTYAAAAETAKRIVSAGDYTPEQVARIRNAVAENDQIQQSFRARGLLTPFLARSTQEPG